MGRPLQYYHTGVSAELLAFSPFPEFQFQVVNVIAQREKREDGRTVVIVGRFVSVFRDDEIVRFSSAVVELDNLAV